MSGVMRLLHANPMGHLKSSSKSGLHIINIHFYYEGGFEPYNINIISYQSETGEPKFKYYNEWTIKYNNINSKSIISYQKLKNKVRISQNNREYVSTFASGVRIRDIRILRGLFLCFF